VTVSDTQNTRTDPAKAVQNSYFIADISKKITGMSFIADGHVCIVGNTTELLHLHPMQQPWFREPYDTLWNRLNFVNWHLHG